jgi:hypothetical protein
MLVICHVRVVDLGAEVELRWLKRVVFRKDEEELEFAALARRLVCAARGVLRGGGKRRTAYGDASGPVRVMSQV